MAWIRLTQDHGSHKAGEKVDFPAVLARELCKQGKAVCGVAINSYEKATVSYETRETVKPKPKRRKKK